MSADTSTNVSFVKMFACIAVQHAAMRPKHLLRGTQHPVLQVCNIPHSMQVTSVNLHPRVLPTHKPSVPPTYARCDNALPVPVYMLMSYAHMLPQIPLTLLFQRSCGSCSCSCRNRSTAPAKSSSGPSSSPSPSSSAPTAKPLPRTPRGAPSRTSLPTPCAPAWWCG